MATKGVSIVSADHNRTIDVLFVDDDPTVHDVIGRRLAVTEHPIEVTSVPDATEALARLETDTYDCVLCDYQMPGMDGLTLLDRVRAEYGQLPFILYTGEGDEVVASQAISAGVDDYLRKDFDQDAMSLLASRIETLVENHRMQRDLERRERRLSKLLDHSPVVTRLGDASGTNVYVSPSSAAVLGYDPAELVGGSGFEYIHPDDRDAVRAKYDRLLETDHEVVTAEYRYLHGDGDWRWVRSNARNLLDDPDIGAVVITTQDISEVKERERELERQNDRLEEFASVVSHDLRNPLTVIQGRAELAQAEDDSEHLDDIQSAAERMETLIDELLMLARRGQTIAETEPVDLAAVAAQCRDTVETASASYRIETDAVVQADESRVQQLLENLVRNAVEHGGDGVTITVGDLDDGFYVEDDGPGIPEDAHDTIFERGYSTTEDGTGYGLAIVEVIADAHGWTVDVTTAGVDGTRFEVSGVEA